MITSLGTLTSTRLQRLPALEAHHARHAQRVRTLVHEGAAAGGAALAHVELQRDERLLRRLPVNKAGMRIPRVLQAGQGCARQRLANCMWAPPAP